MIQTALITGGSQGIGAATALALAQDGFQVAVNYHTSKEAAIRLVEKITRLGGRAVALEGDVSDPKQARQLVVEAEERLGPLTALICNAGVSHFGLLADCTDDQWHRVMGVNLDGVFYTMRAAIPGMVSRKGGSIVTVSSMWGVTGGSCEGVYSAAKAGVIGLTKAVAKELGPSGVRVNCLAPGVIDTAMNGQLTSSDLAQLVEEIPLGRLGTPQEVAQVIQFLCSPAAGYLTGQVIQPNGGILI